MRGEVKASMVDLITVAEEPRAPEGVGARLGSEGQDERAQHGVVYGRAYGPLALGDGSNVGVVLHGRVVKPHAMTTIARDGLTMEGNAQETRGLVVEDSHLCLPDGEIECW